MTITYEEKYINIMGQHLEEKCKDNQDSFESYLLRINMTNSNKNKFIKYLCN